MQEENEKNQEIMELALLLREKDNFKREMDKMKIELSEELKNGVGDDIKNSVATKEENNNKFINFIKKLGELCH
jgi:hypothetical protein